MPEIFVWTPSLVILYDYFTVFRTFKSQLHYYYFFQVYQALFKAGLWIRTMYIYGSGSDFSF